MVRTVTLDSKNHTSDMFRNFEEMRRNKELGDFVIKVEEDRYHVHKVILAAGSPYFKAMLKPHTKESEHGEVVMKDVDSQCVKSCIAALYTAVFDIPDDKIKNLLHVADVMQLEDVKTALCDILAEELCVKNFYETTNIAEWYYLTNLSSRCDAFCEGNFVEIFSQPGFEIEKTIHLEGILKSRKLRLNEIDKLRVCLSLTADDLQKEDFLIHLVSYIRLKEIPVECLIELLKNHPTVKNNIRLYRLINTPLLENTKKFSELFKCHYKEIMVFFDNTSDSLCSYNSTTKEVSKFHDEKFKDLQDFSTIAFDSYIYILGENQSFHRLDIRKSDSKWERLQKTGFNHGNFSSMASLLRSIYVVGSIDELSKVVEKFDVDAKQWLRLDDKPSASQCATLVSLGDSIYFIGGVIGQSRINAFSKFTPSISKWIDLEPMKIARIFCGAAAAGQRIFVIGGDKGDDQSAVKDTECYDIVSCQWTSLSPIFHDFRHCIARQTDGWIYSVACGSPANDVVKYDIDNDRWFKMEFKGISSMTMSIYDFVIAQM